MFFIALVIVLIILSIGNFVVYFYNRMKPLRQKNCNEYFRSARNITTDHNYKINKPVEQSSNDIIQDILNEEDGLNNELESTKKTTNSHNGNKIIQFEEEMEGVGANNAHLGILRYRPTNPTSFKRIMQRDGYSDR